MWRYDEWYDIRLVRIDRNYVLNMRGGDIRVSYCSVLTRSFWIRKCTPHVRLNTKSLIHNTINRPTITIEGRIGSALDHISLPHEFESRQRHI